MFWSRYAPFSSLGKVEHERSKEAVAVRLTYNVFPLDNAFPLEGDVTIQSLRCDETRAVFEEVRPRRWRSIERVLERKLQILDVARTLNDLRIPPSNRLEALKGARAGRHSIRVNDQFRLCFRWTGEGPEEVECVDYH
jgi:proteic killer suppression protein